ncbi:MAG: hypothetical protein LBK59_08140 [Bifidobacteriaceae bacterium]|jgi:DNA anti-recombination protein RmuC|nr:hypothetical protein [Bifidobacteriaceae bacterium]
MPTDEIRDSLHSLLDDIREVRADMKNVSAQIGALKEDIASLRVLYDGTESRVGRIEKVIIAVTGVVVSTVIAAVLGVVILP